MHSWISFLSTVLVVNISVLIVNFKPTLGEREVLIRDRLVLVLCDQVDSYLSTGNFPPPVKKMPSKYKHVIPGPDNPVKMDGFKVVFSSENKTSKKTKREAEQQHPILDFMS